MLNMFKSLVSDAYQAITHLLSTDTSPQAHQIKINFDTTQLIPSGIKAQEFPKWIEAYLKELPNKSALIWLNQNQLQLSFSQDGSCHHIPAPQLKLDVQTQFIQHNDINISLKDIIKLLNKHVNNLDLTAADVLFNLKFKVQFAQKFISEELLTHLKTDTQRTLTNLESSAQCSICIDEYTNDHPPYLVLGTTSVYHLDCLDASRRSRGMQNFRDPKTNKLLGHYADQVDMNQIMKKDEAYLSAINDVKVLTKRTKQMNKALDILVQENKELKAKLAQGAAPLAIPSGPGRVVMRTRANGDKQSAKKATARPKK